MSRNERKKYLTKRCGSFFTSLRQQFIKPVLLCTVTAYMIQLSTFENHLKLTLCQIKLNLSFSLCENIAITGCSNPDNNTGETTLSPDFLTKGTPCELHEKAYEEDVDAWLLRTVLLLSLLPLLSCCIFGFLLDRYTGSQIVVWLMLIPLGGTIFGSLILLILDYTVSRQLFLLLSLLPVAVSGGIMTQGTIRDTPCISGPCYVISCVIGCLGLVRVLFKLQLLRWGCCAGNESREPATIQITGIPYPVQSLPNVQSLESGIYTSSADGSFRKFGHSDSQIPSELSSTTITLDLELETSSEPTDSGPHPTTQTTNSIFSFLQQLLLCFCVLMVFFLYVGDNEELIEMIEEDGESWVEDSLKSLSNISGGVQAISMFILTNIGKRIIEKRVIRHQLMAKYGAPLVGLAGWITEVITKLVIAFYHGRNIGIIVIIVSVLAELAIAVTRFRLFQTVSSPNYGKVFLWACEGQLLAPIPAPIAFQEIFNATKHIRDGLVFIIQAALLLLPCAIFWFFFKTFKHLHQPVIPVEGSVTPPHLRKPRNSSGI